MVDWIFPVEGETPKVLLRILGADDLESAYLDAIEHFKKIGDKKPDTNGAAFLSRERIELVWRAYRDEENSPLAVTADDLAKEPAEVIVGLFAEWNRYQNEVTARPATTKDLEGLVAELKKNILVDQLSALPSSWLIGLITTLVSQQNPSMPESGAG